MGKFKVNCKTGIFFCIVILDTVSGLPFKKIDDIDGKTVTDDSVDVLKDNPALLTRIQRELHNSDVGVFEAETSDEANASIDSRFGFNGFGQKSKPNNWKRNFPSFQDGAGKFPLFYNTMIEDYSHFPCHYDYQPIFGLEFDGGYHGPILSFEHWNNGHGNKFGRNYHHGWEPNYHEGYRPIHDHGHHYGFENHPWKKTGYNYDQGHHTGFENHPWKKPGYDYKPPSGFDGNRPWDSGFVDKVKPVTTTTQKTTTLPQIDIRFKN